jgi:hypothetical protein
MDNEYTREDLIAICERGFVPVDEWHDRDSAGAQRQLGEALALLRSGCDWWLASSPVTDDRTIWIEAEFPGFNAFEYGRSDRSTWDCETFYLPTAARLDERSGSDWY